MNAWWHGPFVALDIETTGLSRETDVITEVAAVRVERGVVQDVYGATLLGAPAASGVAARLAPAPAIAPPARPPAEVWRALDRQLRSVEFVVAYHAAFDYRFVVRDMSRAGCFTWRTPMLDPWLCEAHDDDRRSNRLVNACIRRGVAHHHPHQAESDAQATAALFVAQAEAGLWGAGDLGASRRLQCQWRDAVFQGRTSR